VARPEDPQIVKIIHRMVERFAKYGPPFENNSKFGFLFDNDSPEHTYYCWKLYSILQGDPKKKWRTEVFHMFNEGLMWVPPEIPFDEDAVDKLLDSDEGKNEKESMFLKVHSKHRLEVMLRKLTYERGAIAKVMTFSIDYSDAADEIVDIICKTLVIKETPIPTK
ncbi:3022_t:CDS:2, partial [Scutellospora calospora]